MLRIAAHNSCHVANIGVIHADEIVVLLAVPAGHLPGTVGHQWDAVGGQQERYSADNCWFNDLPRVNMEKGAVIEEEVSGGFTPSDLVNLDKIA